MKFRRRAAPRPWYRTRRAPTLQSRRTTRRRAPTRRAGKLTPRKRKQAPEIPFTPSGPPPSYFELLQNAVLTLKDERMGASLPEIRRQMVKKYGGRFDKASNDLLTTALERLAERGKVIYKHGYKYRFNAPKIFKHKKRSASGSTTTAGSASTTSAFSALSPSEATSGGFGATSGSWATSGSATDATGGRSMDSCTSASSESDSRTNSTKSTRSTKGTTSTKSTKSAKSAKRKVAEAEPPHDQEKAPQQEAESPNNVEKGKNTSAEDVSSSDLSTSATTGGSSRRRR